MGGTGQNTFSPDSLLTREQLAVVLYRLAGAPEEGADASYPDVAQDSAFYPAIAWVTKNGLMSGLDTGLFEPQNPLTREQLAICLEKFAGSAPGFYDAILMDLRMPVMTGLEASMAIRALERPDALSIPIIAMTADAFAEDIQNCLNSGMNAHIAKPIDLDEMTKLLEKYL